MLDTLTVTQYSTYIKQIFDAEELLHNIKIVGEISGISLSRNAVYFSLKDEGGMISCVTFYPSLLVGVEEGEKIIVTGSPNYYIKGGRLSFNVQKIERSGKGDLYAQFLFMKEKLEKEGLFAPERKKHFPQDIKTIGVITSKEGAVIHDIINVSTRRDPSINIALYPVKVQGNGAEFEIAEAINKLSSFDQIDVIVVARGGGSLEDLAAYNTEVVARATAECQKFLVSAVGHETDFTIIDFVSDLRAPTPSAAAELLTQVKAERSVVVERLKNGFLNSLDRFVEQKLYPLDRLEQKFSNKIDSYLSNKDYELGLLETSLKKLSPYEILKRGYAVVSQGGQVVDKAGKIMLKSDLNIRFFDGSVVAEPKEVKNDIRKSN